ncbi:MAG TPA: lipopolysaccharide kinase InaA family protein [Prolixibacteraceae bacterium]|nr:lipopolysaccharide kinase InaA family protein [Prolixibacteraceae bacterium]
MKTEIFVNPAFSHLTDFIQQIPDDFPHLGDEVYVGRNDVHLIRVHDYVLAIKYFKRLTLANRYIFSTFRKPKARRAYEYSCLLINKGITTPEPVAYINCYKYGMLYKDYYVSLYTSYSPILDFLKLPVTESEQALKALASFIYRVHQAGVFHQDLTTRNILYSFAGSKYDFSLIDNNRMRFYPYTFKRGMQNLSRLSLPVETIGIVAAEYARMAKVNDVKTLNAMVFARRRTQIRVALKQLIKMPLYMLSARYRQSSMIIRKETNIVPKEAFNK